MFTAHELEVTDRLLTTTRSVRKLMDLDRPVEREVIQECLEIALQAATGGNTQRWRWIVVVDADKRAALGGLYRKAFREILARGYGAKGAAQEDDAGAPGLDRKLATHIEGRKRLFSSVEWLIENIDHVPVHVVCAVVGRSDGAQPAAPGFPPTVTFVSSQFGSIYPAIWNLQLALRSRGLGSCITCAHLDYEREAAELLEIPYDQVMQVCLLPVAYYTGETFSPAARRPIDEVVFTDTFDVASLQHDW